MARPKKNTIDYFSHNCEADKSLYIIEKMYNNDGYAFYFKLRELLGKTNNHVYDCTEYGAWEYLIVETGVDDETAKNIIDTLIDLGELDKELYNKCGIIWWQSFVDILEDVYSRRINDIPDKDTIFKVEDDTTEDDYRMEYDMQMMDSMRNK